MKQDSKEDKPQKKRSFAKKKLGYRTPHRFRRLVFRRKPAFHTRPRSLGGHR